MSSAMGSADDSGRDDRVAEWEYVTDQRVADWPPPRGPRDAQGQWRWSVTTRPDDSYASAAERRAVAGYRAMVTRLAAARRARDWSLRRLSREVAVACFPDLAADDPAAVGVSLSALTGLEKGSAWPAFETLVLVAWTLDHRVQLSGSPVRGERLPPAADPLAVERALGWDRLPDWAGGAVFPSPQRAYRALVVHELYRRLEAAGLSLALAAWEVGLRPNTVSELRYRDGVYDAVSVRTLSALAVRVNSYLEVVPRSDPWPT